MPLLVRVLVLALVLAGLAPTTADADTARERAGKHVIDGDQLKVQAEEAKADGESTRALRLFEAAADEYQAAYDLVPHPLMLYNLAQVSRLAGKKQDALDFYQEFLSSDPSGEAADFARTYVRILERNLARSSDDEEDEEEEEEMNFDEEDEDPFSKSTAEGDSEIDTGKRFRYAGMGVAAAGIVSIAVGIKYGLDAQSISSCLTNYPSNCDSSFPADRWTDDALLLEAKGKSAAGKMLVFTGLGTAALVAGGVLYYMGERKADESETALSVIPRVDAQSVGFGLHGSF